MILCSFTCDQFFIFRILLVRNWRNSVLEKSTFAGNMPATKCKRRNRLLVRYLSSRNRSKLPRILILRRPTRDGPTIKAQAKTCNYLRITRGSCRKTLRRVMPSFVRVRWRTVNTSGGSPIFHFGVTNSAFPVNPKTRTVRTDDSDQWTDS